MGRGGHLDPLLIGEGGPHVVGLRDDGLVGAQQHARLVHVHVQRAQDEDEAREGGVRRDGLKPVIVYVEQHHLRLVRLQDEVPKLLHLCAAAAVLSRQFWQTHCPGATNDMLISSGIHLGEGKRITSFHLLSTCAYNWTSLQPSDAEAVSRQRLKGPTKGEELGSLENAFCMAVLKLHMDTTHLSAHTST